MPVIIPGDNFKRKKEVWYRWRGEESLTGWGWGEEANFLYFRIGPDLAMPATTICTNLLSIQWHNPEKPWVSHDIPLSITTHVQSITNSNGFPFWASPLTFPSLLASSISKYLSLLRFLPYPICWSPYIHIFTTANLFSPEVRMISSSCKSHHIAHSFYCSLFKTFHLSLNKDSIPYHVLIGISSSGSYWCCYLTCTHHLCCKVFKCTGSPSCGPGLLHTTSGSVCMLQSSFSGKKILHPWTCIRRYHHFAYLLCINVEVSAPTIQKRLCCCLHRQNEDIQLAHDFVLPMTSIEQILNKSVKEKTWESNFHVFLMTIYII